jgi:hypothetical protein
MLKIPSKYGGKSVKLDKTLSSLKFFFKPFASGLNFGASIVVHLEILRFAPLSAEHLKPQSLGNDDRFDHMALAGGHIPI